MRSGGLDVGSAGTILVVGSRVDAETLTRARAMGVRGVVVAGLSSKERRDFLASEARQRAALHRLPPFAVLVLDGATRRPLAGAVQAVLAALAGHEVAIVTDPPMLVFDLPNLVIPDPPVDLVRIRAGSLAGREGRFVEAIGRVAVRRRGSIWRRPWCGCQTGPRPPSTLGDLERFVGIPARGPTSHEVDGAEPRGRQHEPRGRRHEPRGPGRPPGAGLARPSYAR